MQTETQCMDLEVTHSLSPPWWSSLKKHDGLLFLSMAVWIMSKLPLSIQPLWEFTEVYDASGNPTGDPIEKSNREPLAGSWKNS